MADKKAFKSKTGFDASDERMINVATPLVGTDGVNKDYADTIASQAAPSGPIFISNAVGVEQSAILTKKNNLIVLTATSATTNIDVSIYAERGDTTPNIPVISYVYTATIEQPETGWTPFLSIVEEANVDLGINTEQLIESNKRWFTVESDKPGFTARLRQPIGVGGFLHVRNGNSFTYIELSAVSSGTVSSTEFTGSYTASQTEYRDAQTVGALVQADQAIYEIEWQNADAYSNAILTGSIDTSGSPTTSEAFTITVDTSRVATYVAKYKVRVKNEFDAWSPWFEASGTVDHTDQINVNNVAPSVSNASIAYPNSQLSLNDSVSGNNQANLSWTNVELGTGGSVNVSTLGGAQVTLSGSSQTSRTAIAINSSYQYNTNNVEITLTRTANGRTGTYQFAVNVASEDQVISTPSVTEFRSGINTGELTSFNIPVNQRITSSSVSLVGTPTGITVSSEGSESNSGSTGSISNASLTVQDAANRGNFQIEVSSTNESGRVVTQQFTLDVKGFASRDLASQDITVPIQITNVVVGTDVVCYVGNSVANLVQTSLFSTNFSTPRAYGFQGDANDEILEFQIYQDSGDWYVVFDNNVASQAGPGGWSGSATIRIEETL